MLGWIKKIIHGTEPIESDVISGDDKDDSVNWEEELQSAVEEVCENLSELTDEQFWAELEKHIDSESSVPECTPDTCNGECQGMGGCDVATEFRNAIVPPIINKPHEIGCKCNICNSELVLKENVNQRLVPRYKTIVDLCDDCWEVEKKRPKKKKHKKKQKGKKKRSKGKKRYKHRRKG